MPSRIYYQSNKENYSQYQRKFYNDNKETIKEQARIRYKNLSPEEKQKRNEYAKNRYNNLSEDKKMEKEHMVKTDIITYPVNNCKNIKNIKKIIKKYIVQKKNKSYKIVKRNKVILTKMQSWPYQKHNRVKTLSKYCKCLINYRISTYFLIYLYILRMHIIISLFNIS